MPPLVRRSRATAVVVVGLAVCSLVLAPTATAAATGTVTGTVVDDTGAPVAGLVVSARTGADDVLATTSTASDGSYRLTAPAGPRAICFDGTGIATASGGYSFTCSGGATAATATPVRVVADQVRPGVDGTVTRRAVIRGRVTDSAGPVTGVDVDVTPPGTATTTGSDGRYRLVVDPILHPTVLVCFDGAGATGAASVEGYQSACRVDLAVAPGAVLVVDQTLDPAAGAAGRVTDAAGNPVAGAQVILSGVTVKTRADGTWRAIGADPGRHWVIVAPPTGAVGPGGYGLLARCVGGGTPYQGLDCGDTPTIDLVAGRVTRGLDVVLPNASGLTGRVTDDRGVPIPDVPLILGRTDENFPILVTTGADGYWIARNLPPGDDYGVCTWYGVTGLHTPDPDGYSENCLDGPDGRIARFTLAADDHVDTGRLVLTGLGRAVGRVLDAVTGRPVAGVDVAVQTPGQEPVHVTTGPDGSYTVGDLIAGENAYCAFPRDARYQPPFGYAGSCPPQPISTMLIDAPTFEVWDRGDTTAPTIRLVQNATVAGRVTDRTGFALRRVHVVIRNTATDETTVVDTDADGRWLSRPLSPGTVTVCFDGDDAVRTSDGFHPRHGYAYTCFGGTSQPTPIRLTPGQTRRGVDVVLTPRPAG